MNLIKAIDEVKAVLQAYVQEGASVDIMLWGPAATDAVGVRVAEVNINFGNPDCPPFGGSTAFQNDMGGGAVACFYAERSILARTELFGDLETIEADYRLIHAVLHPILAEQYLSDKGVLS